MTSMETCSPLRTVPLSGWRVTVAWGFLLTTKSMLKSPELTTSIVFFRYSCTNISPNSMECFWRLSMAQHWFSRIVVVQLVPPCP
jgi:hypothetical protein